MMRIVILTETFPSKLDGNVSILCLALRRLHERGCMDQLIEYYHLAMRIHQLRLRSRPHLDIC